MLTCRVTRWKLFGPEPVGPQSPYYHVFPRWSPAILLTVLERSRANILSVFSPSVFSFPLGSGIQIDERCKTILERFDLIIMMI
jgi:hypothetical protein